MKIASPLFILSSCVFIAACSQGPAEAPPLAGAWAQGGIAAVLDAGDTFENHVRDTMVAGAGLNDSDTVEFVIERAPASIDRLCELGVPFNRDEDALHLTREGGHSHRRIVHGFVFPWAWIGSLFDPKIAVYAVPNTGSWYDFGFFLGITVLGGGSFFGSKKRRD